ncbi:protein TonB [Sphingomonas palmae]|uniref:Protein TonB n=1 Tax=Sphingomonas palmae TaxID=1855283 RepID=A0A1H7Q316_9SPHN|nr:energy transducer TonB [Sphingomonas palmae]SEL42199.1 protein TonB [Sphingomonas palmae]
MTAKRRERAISAGAVVALHAGLLWLILTAPQPMPRSAPGPSLATFDVVPPPVPPHVQPRHDPSPARERPNGLTGAKAERSAVVVPAAVIPPPVSEVAAAEPQQGTAAIGGSAATGSGTGAGEGGSAAGGGGSGNGSGTGGRRARLIVGAITSRDYPKEARAARVAGSVTVAFTVGADGRASDCAVTETSGNAALDAVTCRLIEARFRYAPALSAYGQPISERRGWRQRWWLE